MRGVFVDAPRPPGLRRGEPEGACVCPASCDPGRLGARP